MNLFGIGGTRDEEIGPKYNSETFQESRAYFGQEKNKQKIALL